MDSYVESNVRHLSTDCSSALTATCTTCCTDALQAACTLKVSWGSGGGVFDRKYRKSSKSSLDHHRLLMLMLAGRLGVM